MLSYYVCFHGGGLAYVNAYRDQGQSFVYAKRVPLKVAQRMSLRPSARGWTIRRPKRRELATAFGF